ncbi:uncharacterized protein LOC142645293 [Dermatophagoides pteronyssinus]|uniref:uncharacterized protein LOC142645293 n=1 Tax=Dermatophagoides pteronyssinus TaxID=6956 RepID=UPI003F67C9D4
MTNNFQIGSLTELVERSGMKMMKKKKPIDKMKSSSPVMKKIMKMKKSTKMQTKKSIILNKKKKTLKKLTTIIEPAKDSDDNDDDDVDQEMNVGDNQTIPESNDDDNSEKQDSEKQMRTLFIGNLPANFPMKNLKKILEQYGKVISIRIRCVAPAKITLSKKVAFLSNQINSNKKTVNAYVVFKQSESVQKALELNGTKFEEHTIQVDSLENDRHYDHSKSLFLGNLSFKTTEDELREFFNECGEIKSVRIVRDSKTGIGKGFGYVNFADKDSVVLALEKNGQMLKNREIRIKPYQYNNQNDNNKSSNDKKIKKLKKKQNQPKSDDGFQGEFGVKKSKNLTKKSNKKNRLNASKIRKQKKTIAQIMNKK